MQRGKFRRFAQHEPVREPPKVDHVAVPQVSRSGQLLVVDPRPCHGFFVGEDVLASLFFKPGVQRRDGRVVQNVGGLDRVRAKDDLSARNGNRRRGDRLAVILQADQVGFSGFGRGFPPQVQTASSSARDGQVG